jgi:hypothetical protein
MDQKILRCRNKSAESGTEAEWLRIKSFGLQMSIHYLAYTVLGFPSHNDTDAEEMIYDVR